uniref:Uncharacterized protein n=1 Tax=Parascaris equorum TaxID=6256 RepID=A0A914RNJ7_PAREQ
MKHKNINFYYSLLKIAKDRVVLQKFCKQCWAIKRSLTLWKLFDLQCCSFKKGLKRYFTIGSKIL